MTGGATQQSSVAELIGTMRRIVGLANSRLAWDADGSPTELWPLYVGQLRAVLRELADTEPASLEDVAALVSYGKAHCDLGAQAARDFDPMRAAADLEIAIALLAKASKQLETMTGVPGADAGLGALVN